MRKLLILCVIVLLIAVPVNAMDFTAPTLQGPAEKYFPENAESFGDGLLYIIQTAFVMLYPSIIEASGVCLILISASLLMGLLSEASGSVKWAVEIVGVVFAGVTLLRPLNTFIHLGAQTVDQISQYGNLLLPVLTGAMAAQGAVTKSGALYVATAFFDTLLSNAMAQFLVPMVYYFLCVSISCRLFSQSILEDIRKFLKWLITWSLKIALYLFTGYISITGVVGGTTDATLLKATKLTISGMVPVVGGIMSDASEAVLTSAGMMKNAAGIYGMLAILAIWIGPFLQIGAQYLLLKATAGICNMFGSKRAADLIQDFSTAMGLVLAMTGAGCLIFMISTICFLKGVS